MAFLRISRNALGIPILLAGFLGTGLASDPPSKGNAPPADAKDNNPVRTAALIDVGRSPVGALLEVRLARGDMAKWLERENVDRLLKEKELQALFGPKEGRERAATGQLLKADFLVLLRPAPSPEKKGRKSAELVVCETRGGLRLCAHTVTFSSDAEADVAALEQLVNDAIRRHGEKVTEVCAVPPFISNDLTHQHDYLKAAYARIVEQMLLQKKGVLVVELAEAEALAKEVALTDPGARLERRSPLFLLGEYRNEGAGDKRRVKLGIRLTRGGKDLGSASKADMPPDEVPDTLRRLVSERTGPHLGKGGPMPDVAAEAKQLAERARLFKKLGNWEESLALVEASLLIRPGQTDLHHDAVVLLTKLTRLHWYHNLLDVKEATLGLNYYRRGLQHLEAFMQTGGELARFRGAGVHSPSFLRATVGNLWGEIHPKTPQAIKDLVAEVRQEQRGILLRLVSRWKLPANWDESSFLIWALDGLSEPEQYALILKTIIQLKDAPGGKGWARVLALRNHDLEHNDTPAFREFLKQMAAVRDREIQAIAETLARELDALAKEGPAPAIQPDPVADPKQMRFEEVKLLEEGASAKAPPAHAVGCLPLGPRIDLFWNSHTLYLMRDKGYLKRVWASNDIESSCTGVSHDGRYVWAAFKSPRRPPSLLILDPAAEKVWPVTADHGLPLVPPAELHRDASQYLMAASVGPGRACVAGTFGRAWLALVAFDPKSGPAVTVFHEAREAADPQDKEQWRSTAVAFAPSYMFTLTDGRAGGHGKRVLLGRSSANAGVTTHPLLIDADKRSIRVLDDYLLGEGLAQRFDVHQGALFLEEAQPKTLRLARVGFPGLTKETVLPDVPEGFVILEGDRLHILGKQWWTGSLTGPKPRVAAVRVPWYFRNIFSASGPPENRPLKKEEKTLRAVCRSSHYGLLLFCQGIGGDLPIWQAEVQDSPK